MQKLVITFVLLFTLLGCNTCEDCEPFAEEPFVKFRFYKAADSTANVVIIDSINHKWAANFEYFQDTVNTYNFPLNMNADVSNFEITFRDFTDLDTYISKKVEIRYQRSSIKRIDNNIIQQNRISEVSSDFELTNLLCGDSLQLICNSNEVIFQIYR